MGLNKQSVVVTMKQKKLAASFSNMYQFQFLDVNGLIIHKNT